MSVTVSFECSGCGKKDDTGPHFIRREFVHVMNNWGKWGQFNVLEVSPKGWVASDPYTGACYCEDCWAGIEGMDH